MNKAELVSAMATKTSTTKAAAEKALDAFLSTVKEQAKAGSQIQLVGFGTFLVIQTKATTGVNPQTKQKMQIPSKKRLKLKVSPVIQKEINS